MPKTDNPTRPMFRDPSGQTTMFDKSYEEELEERRSKPVECLGMTFPNDEARRAYFLTKLEEKLQDPAFRAIEGFPIGSDEDILALSDPPYYTACPNPFLQDFVRLYGQPYNPATDSYHREPFAADVHGGKNDPVYNAHPYHTKVPFETIISYIEHYTEPGDVVLDSFCGSGMTGVAAQNSPSGARRAILIDLSTAATHISSGLNCPLPLECRRVLEDGLEQTELECGELYRTCVANNQAQIEFTLWSDVLICPTCDLEFIYWHAAYDTATGELHAAFACPHCGAISSKRSARRRQVSVIDRVTGAPAVSFLQVPVLINYAVGNKRAYKEPDDRDVRLVQEIEGITLEDWFPHNAMMNSEDDGPWGDKWRAGTTAFKRVHELYQTRTLITLAHFFRAAHCLEPKGMLSRFVFTSAHQYTNRLCRLHVSNYAKGGGGVVDKPLEGTLYAPSLSIETNAISRLKLRARTSAIEALQRGYAIVSTQSATSVSRICDCSVDYVFVDPPFGENLAYAELNFPWEAWLRVQTDQRPEAIVSKFQRKGLPQYHGLMTKCFDEALRVLKPGRWMTVVFHNSRSSVWTAIQQALEQASFVVADVRVLSKGKGSFNAVNAAGAVNQDLVISVYKPNGGLEERFRLEAGTEDGAWDFVRTHLRQLPVFVAREGRAEVIAERQNYLLYDRMVAFHVQRGITVPLSAAEFYAGLRQRFPERDGMFFLPDQAAEYDKKRLTVREVEQLQLIVTDESSAIQWLRQQLEQKPQTFQELHPQFLREIGGWSRSERPLELSTLLEQSFLRYDGAGEVPGQVHQYLSGAFKELRDLPKDDPSLRARAKDRWYVPDPNEAGDLEKLRERALLREFDEYVASTHRRLRVFRLEAVRAGFKRAWQARDYQTIIAVAQKIPESVLQEDPKLLMWYDQAVTRSGVEH